MPKHNNVVPYAHFHKRWADRVRMWFDQPAAKARRRAARKAKAAAIAPRPIAGSLRPVVRGQTARYNMRVRAGRGFTLAELKEAGVNVKLAPTIGIAVDHRRTNKSVEALQANVARLKEYMSKLVVLPRKATKAHKKGDAPKATAKAALAAPLATSSVLPIAQPATAPVFVQLTDELKDRSAYRTLRQERTNAKLAGRRAKKAKEAAEGKKEGAADAPAAEAE